MKKVLLTTVMSLMMCMGCFSQDFLNPPKANEKILGTVYVTLRSNNEQTDAQIYNQLLVKAKTDFPNSIVDIREMKSSQKWDFYTDSQGFVTDPPQGYYHGEAYGKVVDLHDSETHIYGNLSQALNKALRNVPEGSRLAIDQVTVTGSMDREAFKDQLLDVLLDKGYRVVAKDYLEKLYDEIKDQGSGIYNDKTTVKEDNFSAVGYYINVKVTETSLRVQVVNVSTGEYEGNATVNF